MVTPADLLAEYRRLAIVCGEASEDGNYKRGNKAFDDLMRVRHKLREAGPEHPRKLLELLEDDSVFVRLKAGIDALKLSPADGERVLTDIAQGPRGMIRFEAEMALKYWRKGEFTITWWDD